MKRNFDDALFDKRLSIVDVRVLYLTLHGRTKREIASEIKATRWRVNASFEKLKKLGYSINPFEEEEVDIFDDLKEVKLTGKLTPSETKILQALFDKGRETLDFEDFEVALQILEGHNKVRVDWEGLSDRLFEERKKRGKEERVI